MPILIHRPRRNRKTETIRKLVSETHLKKSDLVVPLFITEGINQHEPIHSMPGIFRFSLDLVLKEIDRLVSLGIYSFALFPKIDPSLKSLDGLEAINESGLVPRAVALIKKHFPHVCLFCDIALDPFTTHGHDGIVDASGFIDNDLSVQQLTRQALSYAQAGCDVLSPSDMMDGRILAIRTALEENGFSNTSILSYSAKYASSLYGPFRDAVGVNLAFGDKKTYQLDPANTKEAVKEARLDIQEGADMLLIKPASLYLDVISAIKKESLIPVGAYHVSGEYAMVMAAAKEGFLNPHAVFFETLLSIKRAGADFIFTYAADFVLEALES
jgi:porphobilinogen synthase